MNCFIWFAGDDTGDDVGGEGDDQFLADLDIPQAMEEPEAEVEPQALEEPPVMEAEQQEQTEEAPQEETAQAMEEQPQPGGETDGKQEGMEQEENTEPEKPEEGGEQPAEGEIFSVITTDGPSFILINFVHKKSQHRQFVTRISRCSIARTRI